MLNSTTLVDLSSKLLENYRFSLGMIEKCCWLIAVYNGPFKSCNNTTNVVVQAIQEQKGI